MTCAVRATEVPTGTSAAAVVMEGPSPLRAHTQRRPRHRQAVSPALAELGLRLLVVAAACWAVAPTGLTFTRPAAAQLLPEALEGAKELLIQGQLALNPAQASEKDNILQGLLDDAHLRQRLELLSRFTEEDLLSDELPFVYQYKEPLVDNKGKRDHKMQLIMDPCRYKPYTCCDGIYAEPEYKDYWADNEELPHRGPGEVMAPAASRVADPEVVFDFSCDRDDDTETVFRVDDDGSVLPTLFDEESGSMCVDLGMAVQPYNELPDCFDHNNTLNALNQCTGPGGTGRHCVMVGYSSNAFVVECGNDFRANSDCGTYLELHSPGQERPILAETQVAGGLHTGFRLAALPLTYRESDTRVLCNGDYELWWVQRTRHNRVVEFTKKFRIIEPECEFDTLNSRKFLFHQLDEPITLQDEIDYLRNLELIKNANEYIYEWEKRGEPPPTHPI